MKRRIMRHVAAARQRAQAGNTVRTKVRQSELSAQRDAHMDTGAIPESTGQQSAGRSASDSTQQHA